VLSCVFSDIEVTSHVHSPAPGAPCCAASLNTVA
jgi:hypothetical protein